MSGLLRTGSLTAVTANVRWSFLSGEPVHHIVSNEELNWVQQQFLSVVKNWLRVLSFSHFDCFNGSPSRRCLMRGRKMVTNKVALLMALTFVVTPFKYVGISVFCPLRLHSFSAGIQWKHAATASIHTICPAGSRNLKPSFTSLAACILRHKREETRPAPLIRSTAPLKWICGEGWWYLLLATCPLSSHGAGD